MRGSRVQVGSGFTLAEMLIVIGIIAVLIGFLLVVTRKGTESGNKVLCANNLRQLGTAFILYAQDHDGRFPAHGNVGPQIKEDWIYWRGEANFPLKSSPILKYMNKADPEKSLRCPSDDLNDRLRSIDVPYRFSYTMNWLYSSTTKSAQGATMKLQSVVEPGQKIMLIEEDEISLDDGNWHPELLQTNIENFLGTRHDKRRPDWKNWQMTGLLSRPDRKDRGNVAYADGHIDYITRGDTWQQKYYDPRGSFALDPNK